MKKLILSMLLFLPLKLYGETFPDGTKYNLYNDFSGGLNTRDPQHKLQVNESPYLRNCIIDDGEIQAPNGFSVSGVTNTLQSVNFFDRFVKSDGSIEFLVSDSSIVLRTQDFTSFTLLQSGLNKNFRLRGKQVESKYFFTNGSNFPFTYDGSSVSILDGRWTSAGRSANMPKFKYIEYYQSRLWGFNLPDNPSALRWHQLFSTDTVPIIQAPDAENAWFNSNLQLNIDKGNGTVGTFIKVGFGQLYVGKERGIHYIYGNDDTNYTPVPVVKEYGFLSHESISELDNTWYGYGNDGIYQFDGQNMVRISDRILPDMLAVNSGVQRNATLTWESQSDFSRGTFSGSTATVSGVVIPSSKTYFYTDNIVIDPDPTNFDDRVYLFSASSFTPFVNLRWDFDNPNIKSSNTIDQSFLGNVSFMTFGKKAIGTPSVCAAGFPITLCVTLISTTANQSEKKCFTETPPIGNLESFTLTFTSGILFTYQQIIQGLPQYKLEIGTGSGCGITDYKVTLSSYSSQIGFKMNGSTASFISDVTTTTNLSAWNLFTSVNNPNGGSINYSYKTATSPVNIATYPFIPITPGSIVGSNITDTFIQWAASITAANPVTPPQIDNVLILYQQGGASDINPLGVSWKGRYYLAITTTTSGMSSLFYVKSRNTSRNPIAFTALEGINVKSLLKTPDVWYAGASTAGVFYRMDFGTNYNNTPITQIFQSNANNFESPFNNKIVSEYAIDCNEVASSTFTFSTSIDGGMNSDLQINNSGTGRMIRQIKGIRAKGNYFTWRFTNNQLDKPLTVYNWIVYFKDDNTRTNTP